MVKWEITDADLAEQITQAQRAGKEMVTRPSAIKSVEYMPAPLRRIGVTLNNGTTFFFPVSLIEKLTDATDEQLAQVAITPLRDALEWESLDVVLNAHGLLSNLLDTATPATVKRRRGQRRSAEKTKVAHT
jgi:hypothetical protein